MSSQNWFAKVTDTSNNKTKINQNLMFSKNFSKQNLAAGSPSGLHLHQPAV